MATHHELRCVRSYRPFIHVVQIRRAEVADHQDRVTEEDDGGLRHTVRARMTPEGCSHTMRARTDGGSA
jgi:hypothetical protein